MKHFAFNEQENHRGDRNGQYSMATWMNEQSARELYLKPFEMCMKVGDVDLAYVRQNADGTQENATTKIRACQGVMTSFNRIGATWAGGSYDLITGIVRNEWGFDGWIDGQRRHGRLHERPADDPGWRRRQAHRERPHGAVEL